MADPVDAVRRDFEPVLDAVLGIYLYGSHAHGSASSRSDVDVCIVAGPGVSPGDALRIVWTRARLGGSAYDLKVFEEMPVYLQGEVFDTGRLALARDEPALSEYLRRYRKIWDDQAHRNRPNAEDWERILAARRSRR